LDEVKEDSDYPNPSLGLNVVREEEEEEDDLADPPTPSGKLADRIRCVRERCIESLGERSFERAYSFLTSEEEEEEYEMGGEAYDGKMEDPFDRRQQELVRILGEDMVHFANLIEQLIFMEKTHFGS